VLNLPGLMAGRPPMVAGQLMLSALHNFVRPVTRPPALPVRPPAAFLCAGSGVAGFRGMPGGVMLGRHGFPIRPHARPCSTFASTNKCPYGVNCPFHHPEGMAGRPPLWSVAPRPPILAAASTTPAVIRAAEAQWSKDASGWRSSSDADKSSSSSWHGSGAKKEDQWQDNKGWKGAEGGKSDDKSSSSSNWWEKDDKGSSGKDKWSQDAAPTQKWSSPESGGDSRWSKDDKQESQTSKQDAEKSWTGCGKSEEKKEASEKKEEGSWTGWSNSENKGENKSWTGWDKEETWPANSASSSTARSEQPAHTQRAQPQQPAGPPPPQLRSAAPQQPPQHMMQQQQQQQQQQQFRECYGNWFSSLHRL